MSAGIALHGWEAFSDPAEVMPIADLRPHLFGEECWCVPTWDEYVLVHHSMDKREEYEQGRPLC